MLTIRFALGALLAVVIVTAAGPVAIPPPVQVEKEEQVGPQVPQPDPKPLPTPNTALEVAVKKDLPTIPPIPITIH